MLRSALAFGAAFAVLLPATNASACCNSPPSSPSSGAWHPAPVVQPPAVTRTMPLDRPSLESSGPSAVTGGGGLDLAHQGDIEPAPEPARASPSGR